MANLLTVNLTDADPGVLSVNGAPAGDANYEIPAASLPAHLATLPAGAFVLIAVVTAEPANSDVHFVPSGIPIGALLIDTARHVLYENRGSALADWFELGAWAP